MMFLFGIVCGLVLTIAVEAFLVWLLIINEHKV